MTDDVPDDVVRALMHMPVATMTGTAGERRYITTKTVFNDGKSVKLVAEELGGADYISLNFYMLQNGARLYPCEMSKAKVVAFIRGFRPDQDRA